MVQVRTRTRPMRSDSMPKPMPPTTAPISVAVTSEAACRLRQMEVGRNCTKHEAEDQKVEAVHGVAEGGSEQRLPGLRVDVGWRCLFVQVRWDCGVFTHDKILSGMRCVEFATEKVSAPGSNEAFRSKLT